MGGRNPDRDARRPDWSLHKSLGQLKAAGFGLRTWCTQCGNTRPADIDHLIESRGEDASPWDRWVRCSANQCRGRAVFSASTNGYNYFRLTREWS